MKATGISQEQIKSCERPDDRSKLGPYLFLKKMINNDTCLLLVIEAKQGQTPSLVLPFKLHV